MAKDLTKCQMFISTLIGWPSLAMLLVFNQAEEEVASVEWCSNTSRNAPCHESPFIGAQIKREISMSRRAACALEASVQVIKLQDTSRR